MFEQTSQLAEKLAASVSRRGFLGSLGGWAAAAALGVAGMLTGTGTARGDPHFFTCCKYALQSFTFCHKCIPFGSPCPQVCSGGNLLSSFKVHDCSSDCGAFGACGSC
jgi:hypothetical protein